MDLPSLMSCAALWFVLDCWSKRRAQSGALSRSSTAFFKIRCVLNRNPLYRHRFVHWILTMIWLLAFASVLALHATGLWFQKPLALAGLACALGGAAGNLYDILRLRHVVDFIDLGWWPVFNVADAGILGGLALAFLG